MWRLRVVGSLMLLAMFVLPIAAQPQPGTPIDLSRSILLPAPAGPGGEARLWLVFVVDGRPVAYTVSVGPIPPGPGPGPVVPVLPQPGQIAFDEASKLPADARKDAGTVAQVYRATAGQFKPAGPIGGFAAAIAVQRESRDRMLGPKSAAWNPVAETLGRWLNAEMAAGRLKKDDMPALAAIMVRIAEGLDRVR
jgi:hypothetical protein